MGLDMRLNIAVIFLAIALSSCATLSEYTQPESTSALPKSFTSENVLKVHQGMRSSVILKMFGPPKSVRQAICGGSTGHSWTCTTWEYGKSPYDHASFTFSGDDPDDLKLNDFNIERE